MGEHTFLIESDFFTVKWAGFPIFCSLFSSPTSEQSSKQFKSSAGQRIMEGMSPPGLPSGSPSPPRSPPIQPSSSLPQMWSQPRLPPRSAVTLVGGKGGGGGEEGNLPISLKEGVFRPQMVSSWKESSDVTVTSVISDYARLALVRVFEVKDYTFPLHVHFLMGASNTINLWKNSADLAPTSQYRSSRAIVDI